MSVSVDPFVLAPLAFVGLALCWLAVGWVWARQSTTVDEVGVGAQPTVSLARAPAPGARLGPYILADKIGEGAMGEVYRAYHAEHGTWRAVKVLPRAASERDRRRFEKEARLGAELRHPNAVSIYERGQTPDGTSYFAMELVEGITLSELVARQGPQPPARVVQILLQLCAALGEAHDKGLVHRDMKPDNVLLTAGGQAKLIDFGLVERMDEVGHGEADAIVGTPLYISPEAIVAPETVDARSDLYGLGAVAYFLLTGSPVFQGSNVIEVCGHHLHTSPARPSAVLGDDIPAALEQLILDCLAKDAAQRPESAAGLGRGLGRCLELGALAALPSVFRSASSNVHPDGVTASSDCNASRDRFSASPDGCVRFGWSARVRAFSKHPPQALYAQV